MCASESLADEEKIVWLEDISVLPYVRETLMWTHTRRRPIRTCDGKIGVAGKPGQTRTVGYAILKSKAKGISDFPGMFDRRVFWLEAHDRPNSPFWPEGHKNHGIYERSVPCEAVDPLTVVPGVPGRKTDRCMGRGTGMERDRRDGTDPISGNSSYEREESIGGVSENTPSTIPSIPGFETEFRDIRDTTSPISDKTSYEGEEGHIGFTENTHSCVPNVPTPDAYDEDEVLL